MHGRLFALSLLLCTGITQRLPADELAATAPKGHIEIKYCMS